MGEDMGCLVQGGWCMVMGELKQIRISSFLNLWLLHIASGMNTKVFSKAPSLHTHQVFQSLQE
jgi:hypothetical protein